MVFHLRQTGLCLMAGAGLSLFGQDFDMRANGASDIWSFDAAKDPPIAKAAYTS